MKFELSTDMKPKGGQPETIKKLVSGYKKFSRQTLLGITGSGKTFVMANVIAQLNKPALVLAHNKTLAAQLYQELKQLFPKNRVEYFVSYYDYYQPESYIAASDTYIEKDSQINEHIEKMRLRATAALLSRDDVIIVSSISCIYGLGDPDDFARLSLVLEVGKELKREHIVARLVDMQYTRNDMEFAPGTFRIRGDVIDIIPGYEEDILRIELFGDDVDRLSWVNHVDGKTISDLKEIKLFPAKHFVVPQEKIDRALVTIRSELEAHGPTLPTELERVRLQKRTEYDLEMIEELGYCNGMENYSRHFDGRMPGSHPLCLIDYFPDDFLFFIDESHQSIPQSHGMYKGDYSRKKSLVEHGFRLPSAFDNRPLNFAEFEKHFNHVIFVSATPGDYEVKTSGQVVEQIIRPTGLLDPICEVRPTKNQIDNLIGEIRLTIKKGSRILVTTLTKRMAEDLTDYLALAGIKVRYLHSDIKTHERTEIIRQLRAKNFDVLVGINLLREGIDIPEVSLVAILDADKEGFLRNERSLVQTIGRAARNAEGRVIMYADRMTDSIKRAINVTHSRRESQQAFNKEHGIVPKTIIKPIEEQSIAIKSIKHLPRSEIPKTIAELEEKMNQAADAMDFELAIEIREQLKFLRKESDYLLKKNKVKA